MSNPVVTAFQKIGSGIAALFRLIPFAAMKRHLNWKWLAGLLAVVLIVFLVFAVMWSAEPEPLDIKRLTRDKVGSEAGVVVGAATTVTLIEVTETLLEKPGGYLSNDLTPPSIFLDNIPSWEFGVLVQVRDLARSMRNDFSRSRSQSEENPELARAEPLFSINHTSWVFPSAEDEYRKGIETTRVYLEKLSQQAHRDTQFYARADNLRDWLGIVEKRLGNLSQKLGASVGQARINTDLAGDESAAQSTVAPGVILDKTPRLQVDNVFYEARGATWALIHFFKAIELDFAMVLEKKNATVLVQQIIKELEATQATVWSPIILNGGGFGFFANHSLVMASYISKANAAVIDLRNLLSQG